MNHRDAKKALVAKSLMLISSSVVWRRDDVILVLRSDRDPLSVSEVA